MPNRALQLGSVVWADIEDPNGHRKVRPAIVVTATEQIASTQPLRLVAITTRLPSPLPDDYVLLPWDPQGKARSGLKRKCAAVASWQVNTSLDDVQSIVGILPSAAVSQLLAKVAERLQGE